jgi:leader peptidase (prepilin peptidase)/N-methyltransferase
MTESVITIMAVLLTILFTLAGLATGSFLNVCIDRLPARKSLMRPPSHCDNCQKPLSLADNIPLVSYLWLRGRCRYCGARIPPRVLLVEAITGLLFLLISWRFILSPDSPEYAALILTAFWSCIFLVVIFIDLEHQLILNKVTYPAAVIALILLAADSIFPEAGILDNLNMIPQPSILSGLIAGAIGFILFMLVFIINPRGLGMGDVKLVTLIGLATGFPLNMVALFIGIFIGGVAAVFLLISRKKGRKDVMPYGVFLGIGPIVALLWGNEIIDWYMGTF